MAQRLPRCAHEGCTKPHVLGDRFCFEHLDPDELEAALNEPDSDEDLVERIHRLEEATAAPRAQEVAMPTGSPGKQSPTPRIDPPWACGCGRFSTDWPASKAKHLLACDGVPPKTAGRIAARQPDTTPRRAHKDRTPPAAKRKPRKAARRAVQRRKKRTGRELALVPITATGSVTVRMLEGSA